MVIKVTEKFYITTAIPYVNAAPHIGHALEFVQTDVIARFQRILGKDVFLTTGADENSLKNVQAAEDQGMSVRELCDRNSAIFMDLAEKIGLSFDAFVRSSSKAEHWPGVNKLWKLCEASGDIYKKTYSGLYCVGCEAFLKESDLVDGMCTEHKKKPEIVEEENYFFRLSKYQDRIASMIESGEFIIFPEKRKNEMLSFIRNGLDDFSISRSVKRSKGWGVYVPDDSSQTMYVWFDALSCYLTGVGWGKDDKKFEKWWPADAHVIGKGISRFHTLYWPAMLLSAGVPLPKTIFIHGYVTAEGQKMSKSVGNVIDPFKIIEKYGADIMRYYLINEIPSFDDGDFSEARLVEKTNNELIGNLGNFVFRTLSFLKSNFNSKIPGPGKFTDEDNAIIGKMNETKEKIKSNMNGFMLRESLHAILDFASAGNQYFQSKEPWDKVKNNPEDAANTLYITMNMVRSLAVMMYPFLPFTSERLWEQLGLEGNVKDQKLSDTGRLLLEPRHKIGDIEPLFKKIEDEE